MNRYLKNSKVKLLGENNFNRTYQECIIKEELIISDMSEPSDDEEMCDSTTENMQYQMENKENKKNDSINKNKRIIINNQSSILNFLKQPNDLSFKKSLALQDNDSKVKNAASVKRVADTDLAVRKFTKVFCSECNVQSRVIRRKAKCKSCNTLLRYDCLPCKKNYKNYTDLCYHLKRKHVKLTASDFEECSRCKKTFFNKERPSKHFYNCSVSRKVICRKSRPRKFSCAECPYVANYKSNLVSHIKSKHTISSYKCKCGKEYTNERSLRRHKKLYCGKKRKLECDKCGYKAFRKDQLVNHLKLKHSSLLS